MTNIPMTITPFTIVSTIFNEASRLKQTISDLEAQTLKPTEIIITDAGSNDGSIAILEDWKKTSAIKITILIEKGCNVARGRNLAIEAASTEWIVSTDFGCRFHSDWLSSLMTAGRTESGEQKLGERKREKGERKTENTNDLANYQPNKLSVIGGSYTIREEEIQTKAAKANYILSGGYQTVLSQNFIPSSRSIAYKKDVWEQVGKYPEWLTLAADDLVFGMKIQAQNIPIQLIDKPYVYWGRHEKRQQYNKEAFRYGLGDGEAKVNYKNFWSNLIETGLRYTFFTSILLWIILLLTTFTPFSSCSLFLAPFTLLGIPGLRSYYGAFKNWLKFRSSKYNLSTFLYALLMLEQQRINYIKGYIKGYWNSSEKVKQGAKELHRFFNIP